MINNRQAGRRRGRGNQGGGQRPGGGQQGNGSRIDSRSRGNATQLLEKYKNMAADAQRSGDRVTTEYYLQFADHYFRVVSEQRGRFEEQQPQRGRNDFDDDGDPDFGGGEFGGEFQDAGEQARGNEGERVEAREDRGGDRQREDRPREDRQRDDRPRGDRDERPRGERGPRRDGNGDGRPQREWQDRPRERRPEPVLEQQPIAIQPTAYQPIEVAGQRRADPIAASESLETRAEEVLEADRPLDPPRRRGRPRRDAQPAGSDDAAESGFGADRLPPSLSGSLTGAANDEVSAEPKPRRRRARPAEDTPNAAE